MYAMNALTFIRFSQIDIKDTFMKKTIKAITNSKLIFYKKHNLLLYSKILLKNHKVEKTKILNFENFDNNDEDFKENF